MSKEERDIRNVLAKRLLELKLPKSPTKSSDSSQSNTQSTTISNQRAQLRSLEDCMKNLHTLNASKSAEIDNLHKEIKNLNDQIGALNVEKQELNAKVEEHDLLLKEVHRVFMSEEPTNQVPDCCFCCNSKVSSVMIPCGHGCLCYDCGSKKPWDANGRICPICLKNVDKVMKIFL